MLAQGAAEPPAAGCEAPEDVTEHVAAAAAADNVEAGQDGDEEVIMRPAFEKGDMVVLANPLRAGLLWPVRGLSLGRRNVFSIRRRSASFGVVPPCLLQTHRPPRTPSNKPNQFQGVIVDPRGAPDDVRRGMKAACHCVMLLGPSASGKVRACFFFLSFSLSLSRSLSLPFFFSHRFRSSQNLYHRQ